MRRTSSYSISPGVTPERLKKKHLAMHISVAPGLEPAAISKSIPPHLSGEFGESVEVVRNVLMSSSSFEPAHPAGRVPSMKY
jgi:hypothetical protein